MNGHLGVAELLLERGCHVERTNNNGESALYAASFSGHVILVQLLLERGAAIAQQTNNGAYALYAACQEGHVACVQLLLDRHADVSQTDNNGVTALYAACSNGRIIPGVAKNKSKVCVNDLLIYIILEDRSRRRHRAAVARPRHRRWADDE